MTDDGMTRAERYGSLARALQPVETLTVEGLDEQVGAAADRFIKASGDAARAWAGEVEELVEKAKHLPDHLTGAIFASAMRRIEKAAEELEAEL